MKLRIAVAMMAIYLVWGSTYLAIKFAVETIPPFIMAGTRYLIPGILLLIWRRVAGDPAPTRKQWIAGSIVGLFLLLGGNGLLTWAEQRVESGVAALIIATAPIWMVLFNALLTHTRPRWQVIVGLLTGFGGILMLIGPDLLSGRDPLYDLPGMGILLLAALLWAIGSIYSRDANLPRSPLLGTGIESIGGSAGLFLASMVTGEWKTFNLAAVSPQSLWGLLYLIIFGTLIGFVAYTWLLRNAPISLVSTYAYVNPLVAILLGSWLAKESLNWQVGLSAVIIIGSVVLINSFRFKPSTAPAD
jgi:drug/metabolite transporter (DMT)-like permease